MGELKKSWGYWTIISLTITSMIGTGMFFGTGIGARYAGNGVILAWLILIAISTYVAGCFGELIALFPKAGGVYEFSKQAYGIFISFILGWITWIMSTVAITVLTIAALDYILPLGFDLGWKVGIAIFIITFLHFVAYLGVDISGAVITVFAVEIVLMFLSIIVPGILFIHPSNLVPLLDRPFDSVFVALFFMVEALMGWEAASFLAEETNDAAKVIPKALVVTTLIAGFLGLGVAVVSLGVIPYSQLSNLSAPINDVSLIILGEQGSRFISMAIVIALLGSVSGAIISTPRLLLAMARDKVFISQLAAIHPKRKTPHKAIFFQALVSILVLLLTFGQYDILLSIFTPLALVMYAAIVFVVPILRFKLRGVRREFKVPFGKSGPVLVAIFYLMVIFAWLIYTPGSENIFKIVLSLIFFGIPIYLMMIFFYNPDWVATFMNSFSFVNLIFENILLPKRIRREMLNQVKDLSYKRVFEYGAGVGTLTLQVAQAVGDGGFVYATDLSHGNTKLLKKRLQKRGLYNVEVIHDEHHSNRIHPSIRNADVILSVGVLSYIQDVKKVLGEMNRILPDGGQICFVEYTNFFKLLPDQEWLSNPERLTKIFREAGFSVKIHKKKGIFWNYLFIYGLKSDYAVPVI